MNNITIPLIRNILITFYENGYVSIAPQGAVGVIVDGTAMYDDKGYSVGCTQYHYGVGYEYKKCPDLLEYLKSLDLDLQLVYNAFSAQEQMRQQMQGFHFSF